MLDSKSQRFIQAVGILSLAVCATTPFAQQHGGSKNTETFVAPKNCGVLGVCDGGKEIYMYSCKGDDITIRHCGPGSNYRLGSDHYCLGPEKSVSKSKFRGFVRNQISKSTLQGKLGAIRKEDVEITQRDENLDLYEARDCQHDIEHKIGILKNKLEQLDGAISQVVKLDIEGQIQRLEAELKKAQAKVATCINKDAALKKIRAQIEDSVTTICSKDGVHVPKIGTFMHSVLSQYDPSKHF